MAAFVIDVGSITSKAGAPLLARRPNPSDMLTRSVLQARLIDLRLPVKAEERMA